jgi:8-amino-7-oxononanoate synthase
VTLPASAARRLEERRTAGLLRALPEPRPGALDLISNDFLGFAEDTVLRDRLANAMRTLPVGSTASRLVRNAADAEVDAAERALAGFCGRAAGLLYPSGFQANAGLLTALLQPEDTVFSDALNHASIIDALRLSGARRVVYPHGDADALARLLDTTPTSKGEQYVVTESVFGMDGDLAPLGALTAAAEAHRAHVIVDEAHATGLLGHGAGAVAAAGLSHRVLATVHTGGKALGVAGGFVACDADLRAALVNLSRPFVYSTGVMPALAVGLRLAVERWAEVGTERARAVLETARAQYGVAAEIPGLRALPPDAAILPLLCGTPDRAMSLAAGLCEAGFDVRGYRPPTVPEGTSRLRLTVRFGVTAADWARLWDVLRRLA